MSDSAVFCVDGGSAAGRYVLRGWPATKVSPVRLRSVLGWQGALARDTGLCVPDPVPTLGNQLVLERQSGETAELWYWSLVRWVDGRAFNRPYGTQRLERVGEFTARLHAHAAAWAAPRGFSLEVDEGNDSAEQFVRDGGSFLLELDALPEAERRLITAEERRLLERLEAQVRERLSAAPDGREHVGVVHDDLHPLNLLFHGREVRAIDFDGAQRDYFANDLAVSLGEGVAGSPRAPSFAAKRSALLRGYGRVRPPPDDKVLDALLTLKLVRSVPGLARWTRHPREGIAHWAREQLRDRLAALHETAAPFG
jgi:Ser/Thr protein kinase RdoA (MazF antagonist)